MTSKYFTHTIIKKKPSMDTHIQPNNNTNNSYNVVISKASKRKVDEINTIQDDIEFGPPKYIRFVLCNSTRFYIDKNIVKKYSPVLTTMVENSNFIENENANKNQDIMLECPFENNCKNTNHDEAIGLQDIPTCLFVKGFGHMFKLLKKTYYGSYISYSDFNSLEDTFTLCKIANLFMISNMTERCIEFLNNKLGFMKDCINTTNLESIIKLIDMFPEFSKITDNLCNYIRCHTSCTKCDVKNWVSISVKYPNTGTVIIQKIYDTTVHISQKFITAVASVEDILTDFVQTNHDDEDNDGNAVDEESTESQIQCLSGNISTSALVELFTEVYDALQKANCV